MSGFKAPTGVEIKGIFDRVPGVCRVTWSEGAAVDSFQFEGGTEMDWDGSLTERIVGTPLWTDDDSADWLAHHLIPESAEHLSDETLQAFVAEMDIGRLVDALAAADVAAKTLGMRSRLAFGALDDTRQLYQRAKARSLKMRADDLAGETV